MKIAITGHSRGIGKELFDIFKEDNQVEGFSRSNGYDISTQHQLISRSIKDCDIFINNAWAGFSQIVITGKTFSITISKTVSHCIYINRVV